MLEDVTTPVALIVDDECFARLFAVQILLDLGFVVLEAADASEGIAILRDNQDVTIVFTDINMPGDIDGLDLVRQVRKARPNVALLVTSGVRLPSPSELDCEVPFLPKPYTAASLVAAFADLAHPSVSGGAASFHLGMLGKG